MGDKLLSVNKNQHQLEKKIESHERQSNFLIKINKDKVLVPGTKR